MKVECAFVSTTDIDEFYVNDSGLAAIYPDILELRSLSLENNETNRLYSSTTNLSALVSSKKRKIDENSPKSVSAFPQYSDSSKSVSFKYYNHLKDVISADDDYFFYDPEIYKVSNSEVLPGKIEVPKVPKPKKEYVREMGKMNEDDVVVGSEIVPKDNLAKRPRLSSKFYESISIVKDTLVSSISNIYPRRKMNQEASALPYKKSNDVLDESKSEVIDQQQQQSSTSNNYFKFFNPFYENIFDQICNVYEYSDDESDDDPKDINDTIEDRDEQRREVEEIKSISADYQKVFELI